MRDTNGHRPPLTYQGAAEYVGTTVRHMRRMVYERRIPYLKIGRLVRFDPDDLDRWLDAQRVPEEVA